MKGEVILISHPSLPIALWTRPIFRSETEILTSDYIFIMGKLKYIKNLSRIK